MTKEEYIENKKNRQIEMHSAYEMYMEVDHPMPKIPFTEFVQWFPAWVSTSRMEKYWEYYDKKFDIK